MTANPILVETARGDTVESFHRGAFAVVALDGSLIASRGDIRRPIYPRSAIKPLQATVLVESGALDHYGLGSQEVALACASHSGEPKHVNLVRNWLGRLGLSTSVLECGAQMPSNRESRNYLIRTGVASTAIHNNCSGKHAGFLTVAKFKGCPTSGYIDISHPVQRSVLSALEQLTGESLAAPPPAVDGCGIPAPCISLRGVATGFAKLASCRNEAAFRIIEAMKQHPDLVGGSNRFCTEVASHAKGNVLVKVGAEGVYAGMTLAGRKSAFALKIDDGSRIAAEVAAGRLIAEFGGLDSKAAESLGHRFQPTVRNVANRVVGEIRTVPL